MAGLIDVHQHVVYGVDDGPRTLDDSLRMLEAAKAEGILYVVATSHALPSMQPFPLERYYRHLSELNRASQECGLGVTLYEGCEVLYSEVALRKLTERALPTLAGSRFTLVEFDTSIRFAELENAVRQISNIGLIPVVAHCERYGALVRNVGGTLELRQRYRMRLQMNAEALTEKCPFAVRRFCDKLLRADAVDYLATDAHDLSRRPPKIQAAIALLAQRYGAERAAELTCYRQNELFQQK